MDQERQGECSLPIIMMWQNKVKSGKNAPENFPSNKYVNHSGLQITGLSGIVVESQARIPRTDDRLSPVSDLQLAEDIRDMVLHRFYAEY